MASRYAEDLKRIVGVKDTKGELGTYEPREALGPTRGIGYANSSGGTSAASGGPGAKAPVTPPTAPGKLSPLDKTNPETTLAGEATTEADADGNLNGAVSADKLLDKTAKESTNQPVVTGEGKEINNKWKVGSVSGVDCATGNKVTVNMLDDWTPAPAQYYDDGTVKSNEWPTATTPPEIPNFQLGFYWELNGSGNPTPEQASTPREAAEAGTAYLNANPPGGRTGPFVVLNLTDFAGDPTTLYHADFEGATGGVFTLTVSRISCTGTPPDSGSSCPATAPKETSIPADQPIQYKKDSDGLLKTNPFDSNAPVGSNDGVAAVNICGDETGNNITVQSGADGTTLVYQTDTPNGTMTTGTTAAIIGPDKAVIGYTDSVGLSNYTLK